MNFDELNEDNFVMYAVKCYTSPSCLMSEFEGDLKRTKYLKRLFRRYKATKNIKERLILNHIILLNNVFGPEATSRILFFRIDEKDYDSLKTFLLFLNILPKVVKGVRGVDIDTDLISVDMKIADILRNI